ncbi:MAG: formylglycine-generating enzyme family protein [Thermoguttaceae bacterium]|nr:formylglycine-generating enzyme family protein [Thermoguttaceae bacterium]
MPKKSIYWGMLILFLFSTVATAGYFDEDEDEDTGSVAETVVPENSAGAETVVAENTVKTWKHTMAVSVKNGKNGENGEAVSPDNEIKVETDSETKTGVNGKGFWRVEDSISFSFHLPGNASVMVKCALNDECTGNALIQWNGKALRDENGKRKVYTFDGSNGYLELPDLKTDRKENTLTFVCTDGEIGLESLTIYADIEYPSVNINGMFIQLTSPRPGDPMDGKPVTISWEVTKGLADGGWVRILYRTPDMKDWQVVPGLEGITYGAENWGNFTWENPPKAQACEFKIEYNRSENPEDVRRAREAKKSQAISAAAKELILAKKSFLDDVGGLLPTSFWNKYLDELRRDHQTLKAKLKKSLKDESNMDLDEVVQTIDALEQIYFTAFEILMKKVPSIEDEKERKDIQMKVDDFEEKLGQEFSNAREDYGEDEDTKELIPRMFPKERFEQFKMAKKEFDNALKLLTRAAGTRKVWTVEGVEFAFRWAPAGTFTMGSPTAEEGRDGGETQHQVTLTKGFWIMETEVTQKQWKAVMGTNPSYFNGDDKLPVERVSWNDCQEFCKKCTQLGLPVQLPTEAQWEYACQAGSTTALPNGNIKILGTNNAPALDPIAWYGGNSSQGFKGQSNTNSSKWSEMQYPGGPCGTHPVGEKTTNAWGIYDMIGNAWEWCADWYGNYPNDSVTDPTGPSSGSKRIFRGGSWGGYAKFCRSASRNGEDPSYRNGSLGFRCVKGQ